MPSPNARLLSACRLAYTITATGRIENYPADIGFTAPPFGFLVAPIDAALVGTTADAVILAFRDTLPPSSPNHRNTLEDWLNDLDMPLVNGNQLPGLVHQGFLRSLDNLWPQVVNETNRQLQAIEASKRQLWISGHSKGGALAHLFAARYLPATLNENLLNDQQLDVCTFAAPRSGNEDYAKWYEANIKASSRYEATDDVVPHVPPEIGTMFADVPLLSTLSNDGYSSVGELRFIGWDGNVIGDSAALNFKRLASISELLVEGHFDRIVADHSIDPGSTYANAIN